MSAIEIQGLTRRYGRRRGVEGVSLRVERGSLHGFLGPNGAGKTTTIRVLMGLLRADAGSARVLGHDCWRDGAAARARIGYVPGDVRLYPWLDGRRALGFVSAVRGTDARGEGRRLFERFELDPGVRVRRMSRGMRQKLGLVMALAPRPDVLVLDEPTSALDPVMQDRLRECLRERARDGAAVFFSSHTLGEVESLCDHVAIVREGRLVADEPLESLRARAERHVRIRWRAGGEAREAPPASLRVDRRAGAAGGGTEWLATLTGRAGDLAAWLRAGDVEDLEIAPPDLEELFLRFYREEGRE